jgi:hypothetical protein
LEETLIGSSADIASEQDVFIIKMKPEPSMILILLFSALINFISDFAISNTLVLGIILKYRSSIFLINLYNLNPHENNSSHTSTALLFLPFICPGHLRG